MQQLIDTVASNLWFFIGMFVFVVFTVGFVIAMLTPAGRDAIAAASVKFAIAALAFAEKWLSREIQGDVMEAWADNGGYVPPPHPVVQAQVELGHWLSSR